MRKLKFIGVDFWDNLVYRDETGRLWKDINLGVGEPALHSVSDNESDGEPNMPITGKYEFVKNEEE